MQRIPPKERFSRHALSVEPPEALVRSALEKGGFSPSAPRKLLSGGFMNANLLVTEGERRAVFRFYSTDPATASREKLALLRAREAGVKVPAVLGSFEVESRPVTMLEYLPGSTLEDFLLAKNLPGAPLFQDIGAELAKIHGISFEGCGFLDGALKPGGEFTNFSEFLRNYIRSVLSQLEEREGRLSFELNRRTRALVEEKWHLVLAFEPKCELVHCDFNPKNILVTPKGALLAVLDWEFCLSGNGVEDLGNFFRFGYDYPAGAQEWVAQGYRSVSALKDGWEDASRLADLGSMCSFLERKEDYPETFRTARAVIAGTLAHFGY